MQTTLKSDGQAGTCDDDPATVFSALSEKLAAQGPKITGSLHPASQLVKVTGHAGAYCEVITADGQDVRCEYFPPREGHTRPYHMARAVACMLGTDYTGPAQYASLHREVTMASGVGREMKARGLAVDMDVIEDHEIYRVFADVVITNPEKPERGTVHIGDDGWTCWQCHAGELAGGTADLADTIADVLTPNPTATPRDCLRVCLRNLSMRHYVQTRASRRHRQRQP